MTSKRGARWAFGVVAVAMLVGACSSGGDTAAESEESDATAAASAGGSVDCEFLGEQRVVIQANAVQMQVIDNQEGFDLMIGAEGLDAMETAIEAFRPYQDIDTIFGPLKEGLDNLSTDIAAAARASSSSENRRAPTTGRASVPYSRSSTADAGPGRHSPPGCPRGRRRAIRRRVRFSFLDWRRREEMHDGVGSGVRNSRRGAPCGVLGHGGPLVENSRTSGSGSE